MPLAMLVPACPRFVKGCGRALGEARSRRAEGSGRHRFGPSLVAALAVALSFGTANALDQHRRVFLDLEDCLGADASAVRRILAAELGNVLVEHEGEAEVDPHSSFVRADCGVESAIVVVSQPGTTLRFEQRVDLANAMPNARTRLLALSVAELVASMWAAADAQPPESQEPLLSAPVQVAPSSPPAPSMSTDPLPPPSTPTRPSEPPPPSPPERPIGVRAVGVVRVSGSPAHMSCGGGLGVEIGMPFSLGIGADFRYEQGEVGLGALGDAALRVAWGSLLGLVRPLVGWSSVSVGLGAKLGLAWIEGIPMEGVIAASHTGLVAGPAIASHVALHLIGAAYLHVGLELSWITLGVAGTNGRAGEVLTSIAGPQLAITLGFELQPSH